MEVFPFILLLLLTIFHIAAATPAHISPSSTRSASPSLPELHNANHIFNAVRGAMRQWDNSWNHNGMSLFKVRVPKDTLLYHGRGDPDVVKGLEWLAFEPEHALLFARPRPPPFKPPPPTNTPFVEHLHEGNHRCIGHPADGTNTKDEWEHRNGRHHKSPPIHEGQLPLMTSDDDVWPSVTEYEQREQNMTGYLQHYRTIHSLNLLYIDGMSAAKTSKGTLDSQDYLLLSGLSEPSTPSFPFDEITRARGLCHLAETTWKKSHIHGFVRMESGFEIILCQFERNVKLERTQTVQNGQDDDDDHDKDPDAQKESFAQKSLRLYKAIGDRFSGIGGHRVAIDWNHDMVSAYSLSTNLFEKHNRTGEMLPRLWNVSTHDLKKLRDDVTSMILRPERGSIHRIDWQSIADMFVQRYSRPLQALVSSGMSTKDYRTELFQLLTPFVSSGDLSTDGLREATDDCVDQFMPLHWNRIDSSAGQAVNHVAYKICSTLVHSYANMSSLASDTASPDEQVENSQKAINELITWLDWPVWRQCAPGCAVDEVCVIPVWPITGNIRDRESPTCRNSTSFIWEFWHQPSEDGYWYDEGERPGPPRGKPSHGKPDHSLRDET